MPLDIEKLRRLVAQSGSVSGAARRMGMAQPNLARLLRGNHVDISISTLDRIAAGLEVRASDLLKR